MLAVLLEGRDVGDDDVTPKFDLGKHHTRIDQYDVIARAQNQHIHAELAQSAQGNC